MAFPKIGNKSIIKRAIEIAQYSTKLQTRPLSTKAISSGNICGAGDLTCQYIVQHRMYTYSTSEELEEATDYKISLSSSLTFEKNKGNFKIKLRQCHSNIPLLSSYNKGLILGHACHKYYFQNYTMHITVCIILLPFSTTVIEMIQPEIFMTCNETFVHKIDCYVC